MTVFLLKTEEIEALPREFCERNFPGRLKAPERPLSIGAGAMIRYLTKLCEEDIRYNENGKPFTEKGPHFNISHSRDLVAGVSSEAPVGIDLEHTGRNHEGVEKRVFSPEERNLINSGEDDRLFFTAWTLKEACVKLFGKSLAEELTSFSVLPLIQSGKTEISGRTVFSKTAVIGDYVLSVCSEKELPDLIPVFLTSEDIAKEENDV